MKRSYLNLIFAFFIYLPPSTSLSYETTIDKTVSIYFKSKAACNEGNVTVVKSIKYSESKSTVKPIGEEVLSDDHEVIVDLDICSIKGKFIVWLRYVEGYYTVLQSKPMK